MHSHRRYCRNLLAACALGVLAFPALAATVGVEPRADYTRINFGFDAPARLQLGGGGSTAILTFDQPVAASVSGITPQLAAVATGVTRSADGKQVTIALKKNYRVRQFTSGNAVGIDILNSETPEPAVVAPPPAANPEPAPEPAVIAPPAPAPKPVAVAPPTPAVIAPPAPAPVTPAAAEPAVIAPPAPVEPAAAEPAAPTPTEPVAKPSAIRTEQALILSTKPEAEITPPTPTEPVAPVMEEEGPPSPDVPPAAALEGANATQTAIKETQAANPVITTKLEVEVAPKPAAPPAPAPIAEEATVPDAGFVVGVSKNGTKLDFPWKQRTAAAIFERGPDTWIVFSRPIDMNPELLRSVLPTSVIRAEQPMYDGASVLHLTTDGKLHATARQPAGSYGWQVELSSKLPAAKLDVPVSGERDDAGKAYLQISAFDIADPLSFYDPQVGDLLVVIPTYEVGRGVANQKTTPELTVLQTQQGVAIASLTDGLTTKRDRTGVKLYGVNSLAVSQNLPVLAMNATPVPGVSTTASVMIPYEQWYVAPADFIETRMARLAAIADASAAEKPEALMDMVRLFLGQGMCMEALGYLSLIQQEFATYYTTNNLSMLNAACSLLTNHTEDATKAIAAPELATLDEANLWRAAISLTTPPQPVNVAAPSEADAPTPTESGAEPSATASAAPTLTVPVVAAPKPAFDFLKYNKPYIRFYPPRIRQKLAILGADYYTNNGQPEKAVATYDTLNSDGILGPVQPYAELTLAKMAAEKGKTKDAARIFKRLIAQQADPYIRARARYESLMSDYTAARITPAEAADGLERLRTSWRGDGLEREILANLAKIYEKEKRYDDTLRAWKNLLQGFPGDPETLTIAGDMAEMFENLFLHGMADGMPPLKSLALFYEFRELTPIGARCDEIIQILADRLAAVDLLDRATQLLEHQIKFRVSGETRARVGARLALLYLLNKQPQRALEVLGITNYGATETELRRQRLQLTAQALAAVKQPEEALSLLFNDDSPEGATLRLEILWNMQDWPNVVNEAEDMLAARANLTEPLNDREAQVLLKLALAYAFEGDETQLQYLRDYYMGLLGDTQYKEIFDFITNDTNPLDTEDFNLVAQQISRTESFLDSFRKKIAEGNLSEAVK